MSFSGHKILVTGPTGQVGFVVAQAMVPAASRALTAKHATASSQR